MSEPAVTERGPSEDDVEDDDDYDIEDQEDLESWLKKRVKEFNRASAEESANRTNAIDDLNFKIGKQWPDNVAAQRALEGRPCLTINKVPTFVHQITNDQRQNRPAINVSPVGDKGDPETAKMLKGLIRYIERNSNADVAYDTGFESAVDMGWGYWRIITKEVSDDSFDQDLIIEPIWNPFTVYMDPDSHEPDGSDMNWCFISTLMPREEFEDEFPDADPMPWGEGGLGDEYTSWSTKTHVRIAEYFCYEHEERNLVALTNGHVGFEDELDEDLMAQIEANPDLIQRERIVDVRSVKWFKITAKDILDEEDWLGSYIPIVKVVGQSTDLEGKMILSGIIRAMKDSQRMYNFWVTSETELIALAPKAPWIMEEGQVEGHEDQWKVANTKSLPYLLYKGTSVAGKQSPAPQRQQFVGPPAGVVQAKIAAAQDMQATSGIRFDATMQERTYDESGKALRELKRVGDLGNFHYVDNLSRSLRFTGTILIDAIPKYIDTKRVITILREDGSEEHATIDPNLGRAYTKERKDNGSVENLYNPKIGQYSVTVTVGPSFATKRAEAADSMLAFMKAVPQSGPLIGDLIATNMDWPGAEEIGSRLASMLPPHLLDKKLEQLPPEAKALVSSLMQQMQQLKQEHDQAVAMLGDKEADRNIDREKLANERDKIAKDFEAKMTDIAAQMQEAQLKLTAPPPPVEPPEDKSAEHQIALQKIQSDFEAKLMKIQADLENERKQREHDMAIKLIEHESAMDQKVSDQKHEKGLRRKEDMEQYKQINEKLMKRLDETEAQIKGMQDIEIHFDRDPKTNRIAKARRVKKPEARA